MPNATQQPDYIALAMVAALFIVLIVLVIRKHLKNKASGQVTIENVTEIPTEQKASMPAPGSAGKIKLNNVDPKRAAMVMAIVANKMGKPLNELRFISIKEVDE